MEATPVNNFFIQKLSQIYRCLNFEKFLGGARSQTRLD